MLMHILVKYIINYIFKNIMAKVSTYLNFMGKTEEAFNFYKLVFKTEYSMPIQRIKDTPPMPNGPKLTNAELNLVMHAELPITGGHVIMGTDMIESMGHKLIIGNNISLNLELDTRAESDRLFKALGEDGKIDMPLTNMFWGAYFGSLTDKFGVRWMINCSSKI